MEDNFENQEVEQSTELNYIEAIQELKRNSVSKDEYERVLSENKTLINSLVNGQSLEPDVIEDKATAAEIRQKLFGSGDELSNLEYCKLAVELRDAVLREEGKDIFVANNHQITATSENYEKAQHVADVLSECIEYANGDPEVFTNELMRRTNDVVIPRARR